MEVRPGMSVFLCTVCNTYRYDEAEGDPKTGLEPGTTWDDIPETWRCPICDASKESLKLIDEGTGEVLGKDQSHQTQAAEAGTDDLTLVEVRRRAQDKLVGICSVNKVCDGLPERICMGQTYGQPIGLGGVGKGLGFTENVRALDRIKIKTRVISEHVKPDTATSIFGKEISFPIMTSSLSGVKASMGGGMTEMQFATAALQGSVDAGTIGWIGNTADQGQELTGLEAIKEVGTGIPILKPQANERLFELFKMAEDADAIAVGIDLDGCGSTFWERWGKPVYRKSVSDIRELADSTELPFLVKGIMSVEDALDALDAGVDGIDVSNHGGRIMDSTRGVADVLPEIVEATGGKVTITAGGGVRTGFDVMKMLALGADGVLVGRDMVRAVLGGGADGVRLQFEYMVKDLKRGMLLTSCNTVADIDQKVIDKNES